MFVLTILDCILTDLACFVIQKFLNNSRPQLGQGQVYSSKHTICKPNNKNNECSDVDFV